MGVVQFENPAERIMVALDVDEITEAEAIVKELEGTGVTFKVGNQLGTYAGWQAVIELIHNSGAKIFCDTKFKDIPETVKKSARAITRHRPDFFNIMADTQNQALNGAVEGSQSAVDEFGVHKPIILGVTVLTSMSDDEASAVYGNTPSNKVLQFAANAADAGLDGVVCSAQEVKLLRSDDKTKSLVLVTPGIRPSWAASGDQSRITTPKDAIDAGADYLVIGRPITSPSTEIGSCRDALQRIIQEIS